jgi:anthranilate phosphoribosyltransferase
MSAIKAAIAQLINGRDLNRAEACDAMRSVMTGEATPVQIAGFLVALRMKGETVEEIAGFAEGMRSLARPLDLGRTDLVDTCGTGGDGADTFNVSTTAALVAAGAGAPVAKHGNRAVSSICGSADVLEALGIGLVSEVDALQRCLDSAGMVFLFAPAQHPAMKHAIGPRRELGQRTVFNLLGPLTNPAGASRQIVGVYDADLVRPVAQVLGALGTTHVMVVHGAGGLDEISTLGPTQVAEWRDGELSTWTLNPADFGVPLTEAPALAGGDAEASAATTLALLGGAAGPPRDIVALNAAAAIYVAGLAEDLHEGMEKAARSIDTGAAMTCLERLRAATGSEAS